MGKMGMSTPLGKTEIVNFIKPMLPVGATILDMGAGEGSYYDYFGTDYDWTAVEIWHDTAEFLKTKYNQVYEQNIVDFKYDKVYDLVIFGAVLEHLTVEDAQKCLIAAKENSNLILIEIPFGLKQGALYGNEHERHIQDTLTPEQFNEYYPGFTMIQRFDSGDLHGAYYYWKKEN